ncbi:MAG: hypothetical protein KC933_19720 [Myxococcales bacterium]|nr:hypothetical protein [Myxococcales bacterium]MCB9650192.1 hypothetical protein [Deltaproteobacteria bacterium]
MKSPHVHARPPIQGSGVLVSLDTFREGLRSTVQSARPAEPLDEDPTACVPAGGELASEARSRGQPGGEGWDGSAGPGPDGFLQGHRLLGRRGAVDGVALFYAVGPEGAAVLKWLPRSQAEYPRRVSALYTEAQVAQRLVAPGLLPLIHADEDAAGCALVYASPDPGATLGEVQARLQSRGQAMPLGLVARVALEVAEALGFIHGLTARDGAPLGLTVGHLAPDVVTLDARGRVRLATWALRLVPDRSFLPGAWLDDAAVPYVAPECLRGDPWTAAAAVYAVGVMLFELLVGRPAFLGVRPEVVPGRVLAGGLPHALLVDEGVPEGLLEVVTLATAAEPKARYSGPGRLAAALARWLSTERDAPGSAEALGLFLDAHGLLGRGEAPPEDDENTVQADAHFSVLEGAPRAREARAISAVAAPRVPSSARGWDPEGLAATLRGRVIPAVLLSPEAWTPTDTHPTRVSPPPLPPPDPAPRANAPLARGHVTVEALLPLGARLTRRLRRAVVRVQAWLRDLG